MSQLKTTKTNNKFSFNGTGLENKNNKNFNNKGNKFFSNKSNKTNNQPRNNMRQKVMGNHK